MVLSSMIVFIIDVQYLVVLDPEGKAPIASDMQAPDSLPISGKRVRFPEGKGAQFFRILRVLQKVSIARSLSTASGGRPFALSSR
jgi:hypothetical protein